MRRMRERKKKKGKGHSKALKTGKEMNYLNRMISRELIQVPLELSGVRRIRVNVDGGRVEAVRGRHALVGYQRL